MIRACVYCGATFEAARSDKRYCGVTCRMRAMRQRAAIAEVPDPPAPSFTMSQDEVLAVVANAHRCASDMSRASAYSEQPLAGALGRVAARFEDALESEGL